MPFGPSWVFQPSTMSSARLMSCTRPRYPLRFALFAQSVMSFTSSETTT
ncbi:unannotated protein [freshwater metagenome]|uniref:Unannotated protein n=1 Tax=freshwater metagenome TaxID=449393 RepID=A0A6J7HQR3_9ZZZZ